MEKRLACPKSNILPGFFYLSFQSAFMKYLLLSICMTCWFVGAINAQKLVIQSPYKKETTPVVPGDATTDQALLVRMQVDRLFEAMHKADSSALRQLFVPGATLITAGASERNKAPYTVLTVNQFIAAVGNMAPGNVQEVLFNTEVKVDGPLANLWTEYALYANGKFIHCGVDAFDLVQIGDQWLITTIHDTRRQEPCPEDPHLAITTLLDGWHQAATKADAATYFNAFAEDGVFLGTDPSERWTKSAFWEFCKPYFEQKKVWDFKPRERHIQVDEAGNLAWFDELLDTWMGKCRGSGILTKTPEGWKIKQYNLTILVPNEVVNDYLKLLSNK